MQMEMQYLALISKSNFASHIYPSEKSGDTQESPEKREKATAPSPPPPHPVTGSGSPVPPAVHSPPPRGAACCSGGHLSRAAGSLRAQWAPSARGQTAFAEHADGEEPLLLPHVFCDLVVVTAPVCSALRLPGGQPSGHVFGLLSDDRWENRPFCRAPDACSSTCRREPLPPESPSPRGRVCQPRHPASGNGGSDHRFQTAFLEEKFIAYS